MWQRFVEFIGFGSDQDSGALGEVAVDPVDVTDDSDCEEGEDETLAFAEAAEEAVVEDEIESHDHTFEVGDHVQFLGDDADELRRKQQPITGTIRVIAHQQIFVELDGPVRTVPVSTYDWAINGPSLRLTPLGMQLRRQHDRERAFAQMRVTNARRRESGYDEMEDREQTGVFLVSQVLRAEALGDHESLGKLTEELGLRIMPKGYSEIYDPEAIHHPVTP